ncbi:glycosyltransferase [Streptomyces amakusaensis]|uniref:Nucleotide disphospho-sugar-binding domain-containing protein n=1 Tax=Streptomyces amakusaensis TaxID=67271 RepID=A0ABW0AII0_9ACTN
MRILFITRGSPASIFGLVPLATSARNAGHEVLLTSTASMMPVLGTVGLPGVPVTDFTEEYFGSHDRDGGPVAFPEHGARAQSLAAGAWFARLAASTMDRLLQVAADWRPDVVVAGRLDYAGPLLAARIGVPFVRQAVDMGEWDEVDEGAVEELTPELKAAGLTGLPEPELAIEVYPPSLRPARAAPARLMRLRPGSTQGRLERWMYTRPSRPRVCVTPGSRANPEQHLDYVRGLARTVGALDVELVVAVPRALAEALRPELPGARVGWVPLDVLAPTCDLFVHHAGGMTSLLAIDAGVPQLILPEEDATYELARRTADGGAGIAVAREAATPEAIRDACRELLEQPERRARARELSREVAALTPPPGMVPHLEELVR